MAARKLQQEMEREFKKTDEGIELFNGIHEKLLSSQNASQKEKLEDSLKKEIKKLQRSRDKIKSWATQNDVKDKKPLMEKRRAIETCMEKFKAVEKEMKTKQYSKEGLSAATKLDPKEKEKMEMGEFLTDMVDKLSQQTEALEAETESLQAGIKKKKSDGAKVDRVSELERTMERHKWHVNKLEILARALENGSVEVDQVKDLEDSIKYYVEQNQEVDFVEDDTLYDDLNLEEEEDQFGMGKDDGQDGSQDASSVQDELPDSDVPRATSTSAKGKSQSISEGAGTGRRPSVQMKSPLPALSTLHSSLPSNNLNGKAAETMKPAPLPSIPTGQTLKYASAAAAAAASDKNGIGIAPLPPPPPTARASDTSSPAVSSAQPASVGSPAQPPAPMPIRTVEARRQPSPVTAASREEPRPIATEPVERTISHSTKASSVKPSPQPTQAQPSIQPEASGYKAMQTPDSGIAGIALNMTNGEAVPEEDEAQGEEESIYHLPSSLADLLDSFEETKARGAADAPLDLPMLNASRLTAPTPLDAEKPNHYQPANRFQYGPAHYPQEPLAIFDDPRLYSRIDTDSLFYAFYYRQGTYQQYLAAKALKGQSWRFHKQYQTWFQRHEEPKNITEEYEQGTYRFFDYESTWMNRRKADFKFAYKFLEDDL